MRLEEMDERLLWVLRRAGDEWGPNGVLHAAETLAEASKPPRLYVNSDRTEPVPGDVARMECVDHPDDSYTNAYLPQKEHDPRPWLSLTHDPGTRYSDDEARCDHLAGWQTRLLVDGTTGQAVTP